jgi:hypothetical protein
MCKTGVRLSDASVLKMGPPHVGFYSESKFSSGLQVAAVAGCNV